MIRFVWNRDAHEFEVDSSGALRDIVCEIGIRVSTAYNLIRSKDPDAAKLFKTALIATLYPDSPVWDKEDIPDPSENIKLVRVKDFGKEASHE